MEAVNQMNSLIGHMIQSFFRAATALVFVLMSGIAGAQTLTCAEIQGEADVSPY